MKGIYLIQFKVKQLIALCICMAYQSALSMDSIQINDVHIIGRKVHIETTYGLIPSEDVNIKMRSLADLLNENGIAMRVNAPGALSLASLRGLYGNQMNLMWEGISIQSPMNGNLDLSLVPAFLSDQASLQPHSHSSNNGNASLSGTVSIYATRPFHLPGYTSIHSSYGSFGQKFAGIDHAFLYNKTAYRTRICRSIADFNYPIIGYETTPFRKRQENSDFSLTAILQEFDHTLKNKNRWMMKVWLQQSDRGIAESISVANALSRQEDIHVRAVLRYLFGKSQKQNIGIAYNREQIRFAQLPHLVYFNQVQTFTTEWNGVQPFKSRKSEKTTQWNYGVQQMTHLAVTDNYQGLKYQWVASAYTSVRTVHKSIEAEYALRVQAVSGLGLLPAPSMAWIGSFSRSLSWRFHSGFSFRFPTLNDLYWNPGGNPSLLPEKSYKSELSLVKKWNTLQGTVSFFQNEVRDMIVWLPDRTLQTIWTPQNLRGVRVFGIEARLSHFLYEKKNTSLKLKGFISLTRSVYSKTELGNEEILGKQLLFIPLLTFHPKVLWQYHSFCVEVNGGYQSKRFVTTNNSRALSPFFIMGLQLSKEWKLRSHAIVQSGIHLQNALNTPYELQLYRPMPGRTLSFNLIIKLPHKHEK